MLQQTTQPKAQTSDITKKIHNQSCQVLGNEGHCPSTWAKTTGTLKPPGLILVLSTSHQTGTSHLVTSLIFHIKNPAVL